MACWKGINDSSPVSILQLNPILQMIECLCLLLVSEQFKRLVISASILDRPQSARRRLVSCRVSWRSWLAAGRSWHRGPWSFDQVRPFVSRSTTSQSPASATRRPSTSTVGRRRARVRPTPSCESPARGRSRREPVVMWRSAAGSLVGPSSMCPPATGSTLVWNELITSSTEHTILSSTKVSYFFAQSQSFDKT